tara:strand:+ start:4039 stop:4728 length:690 start_codon:yes stop_codon:yes gene_type:complete
MGLDNLRVSNGFGFGSNVPDREETPGIRNCYCFLNITSRLTINISGGLTPSKQTISWCMDIRSRVKCERRKLANGEDGDPCREGASRSTTRSLFVSRECRYRCKSCGSDRYYPDNCGKERIVTDSPPLGLCMEGIKCESKPYKDCPKAIQKIVDRMNEARAAGAGRPNGPHQGDYILEDLPGDILDKYDPNVGGSMDELLPDACKKKWPEDGPACKDIEIICRDMAPMH